MAWGPWHKQNKLMPLPACTCMVQQLQTSSLRVLWDPETAMASAQVLLMGVGQRSQQLVKRRGWDAGHRGRPALCWHWTAFGSKTGANVSTQVSGCWVGMYCHWQNKTVFSSCEKFWRSSAGIFCKVSAATIMGPVNVSQLAQSPRALKCRLVPFKSFLL